MLAAATAAGERLLRPQRLRTPLPLLLARTLLPLLVCDCACNRSLLSSRVICL